MKTHFLSSDEAQEFGVPSWDGHAGAIETSRVMAIRPDLVNDKGEKHRPVFKRFKITSDSEKLFPSGVMGDPTIASKQLGQRVNDYVIEKLTEMIVENR